MTSYIPKQSKQTRERVEAKLEVGLVQKLERYCQYLDSDRDYVISQALEIAFKKDKGFCEWLEADRPVTQDKCPDEAGIENQAREAGSKRRNGGKTFSPSGEAVPGTAGVTSKAS